jgi:hypothetical protein
MNSQISQSPLGGVWASLLHSLQLYSSSICCAVDFALTQRFLFLRGSEAIKAIDEFSGGIASVSDDVHPVHLDRVILPAIVSH